MNFKSILGFILILGGIALWIVLGFAGLDIPVDLISGLAEILGIFLVLLK
jgi:hypothetical protein